MSTTVKRISISLTKEQERQLKALQDFYGENQSQTIHRAVAYMYTTTCPDSLIPKGATPDNPPQS